MKKIIVLIAFMNMCSVMVRAQHNVLSVGAANALTIKTSTIFSADSLVLTPGSDFTMSSNAILETPVPALVPGSSITRVYYLNNPIVFTGTVEIYYQLSELNGNTESSLKYYDSTVGSLWTMAVASTVNTASHYVQFVTSAQSFVAATAANNISALPIQLISFKGNWDGNQTNLTWIFEHHGEEINFTVESSTDGQNWRAIAVVPGVLSFTKQIYHYSDMDAQFSSRLYRIKIVNASGKASYSPIIEIHKTGSTNNIRVVPRTNSMIIYFIGDQPTAVRVLNVSGQTIWRSNMSRNEYEVNNLLKGIYFIQYELNGQIYVKKFPLLQ